ncbi:hypothetical protein CLV62_10321 [Dysgonomonas alginatilytica]|uniref:Uncharacterized protein n=1 Tax=Dysgonomonas alginatilytica TaxID=1605892 RepID=A0A2V3PT24_9BACT|nr:hypothetical protein [Dysgonomonas alginatilytica]PXV67348.1 hypothetical protein CLV62_10321 [Dysgonomonas alginatilytica]
MKNFKINPNVILEEFNKVAKLAQRKAFITVDTELQKEEIETIQKYRIQLVEKKEIYKVEKLENEANLIYCLENSLLALEHELMMLVNIKEGRMNEAWDNLVDAQVTYGTVLKNSFFSIESEEGYLKRLEAYERLLFPPMIFTSVGGIIRESLCSLCNDDYNKCNHIKGKIYNGECCTRIISRMEIEEVSFVDVPANKHCRAITTKSNGKTIDVLTLKEVDN